MQYKVFFDVFSLSNLSYGGRKAKRCPWCDVDMHPCRWKQPESWLRQIAGAILLRRQLFLTTQVRFSPSTFIALYKVICIQLQTCPSILLLV